MKWNVSSYIPWRLTMTSCYFKDEKQRYQRKELFSSFHKLVAIGIASYLYHLFIWQASCITMTTMAVEAAIMQNKHCGTIPEGKSLNECNTFIGINVAYMLHLHPNSTHACWLPEEQQLSTLVRVARLQRTTLQASSYGEMSGHQSCNTYIDAFFWMNCIQLLKNSTGFRFLDFLGLRSG